MNTYQFTLLQAMAFTNLSVLLIILYTLDGGLLPLVLATLALGTAFGLDVYGMYSLEGETSNGGAGA